MRTPSANRRRDDRRKRATVRRSAGAAILLVVSLIAAAPVTAGPDEGRAATADDLVVLFADRPPADLDARIGPIGDVRLQNASLGFAVVEPKIRGARDVLASLPGVETTYPVRRYVPAASTDDPLASEQWGLDAINVTSAWNRTQGSHDVTVSVLDTGVHRVHPDLRANTQLGDPTCGPDVNLREGGPPVDAFRHGTHVAGTVAAAIDNGRGVAGMADACLQVVKVCNFFCLGPHVALGIAHATATGADVISMSFHVSVPPFRDPLVERAIDRATDEGVVLVAAAGNDGCSFDHESGEWEGDTVGFPARHRDVVAVAALYPPGEHAWGGSSCGPDVELAAPGVSVISTMRPYLDPACRDVPILDRPRCVPFPYPVPDRCLRECYLSLRGTSMATPHVSGVAALVLDANPDLSGAEVRCLLRVTADDLGEEGRDIRHGHGRLDAGEAVALASAPDQGGCSGAIDGTAKRAS